MKISSRDKLPNTGRCRVVGCRTGERAHIAGCICRTCWRQAPEELKEEYREHVHHKENVFHAAKVVLEIERTVGEQLGRGPC